MELQGERLIPASVETTWAALNDPETLKACIAGCESMERTADDTLVAVVAMKIGPVSARFKGKVQMTNVQPPNGYTLNFDGQGGVAGFGKGSADVALTPEGEQTRLRYHARATVGGKMAQVGARLIDAAAGKITEDFFTAFEAQLRPAAPVEEAGVPATTASPAPTPLSASERSGGGAKLVWWLIGAVIVLAAVYVMMKK
jgi:carbon monoxide dehydrogenase subunit G